MEENINDSSTVQSCNIPIPIDISKSLFSTICCCLWVFGSNHYAEGLVGRIIDQYCLTWNLITYIYCSGYPLSRIDLHNPYSGTESSTISDSFRILTLLFIEDPTVTVKYRTAVLNLCSCVKLDSLSLRFSQFSGCWLILSVYIIMSFDFPFIRLFGVR
jgi:hypothetical protein